MGCTSSEAGAASAPSAKEQIVVRYFDFGHGRASGLKLMLAHAGANWTFDGVAQADWPALKQSGKTGEFNAMPFIKQGARTIDLNIPAMRCLAREHGYYPEGDWKKCATTDMIAETWADIFNKWGSALINPNMQDADKAKVLIDSLQEDAVGGKLFKQIELAIKMNGGKFLTGNKMTIGDFLMASLLHDYFYNDASPFQPAIKPLLESKYPAICAYAKDLGTELAGPLSKRPVKPF